MLRNINIIYVIHERPVEFLAGVVLVITGVLVAALSGDSSWQAVGGGSVATVGGILLSWSTATVSSLDQARTILQPQLETLCRQLSTASAQISYVIFDARSGAIAEDTAYSLVSQNVATLYGIINELQILAGSGLDQEQIIRTFKLVDELGNKVRELTSGDRPMVHDEESRRLITEVQSLLQDVQKGFAKASSSEVASRLPEHNVICPNCGVAQSVAISTVPGSTRGALRCSACEGLFNVHRAGDGSVFARLNNSTRKFINTVIDCPTCHNHFGLSQIDPDAGPVRRQCNNCNNWCEFDPATLQVSCVPRCESASEDPA